MNGPPEFHAARMAVAELIATERGDEKVTVTHLNEATGVIWPLLSDETRGRLVLR